MMRHCTSTANSADASLPLTKFFQLSSYSGREPYSLWSSWQGNKNWVSSSESLVSLQLLSGSVVMTTCVQRRLQNLVCCLDELGSAGHSSARFSKL